MNIEEIEKTLIKLIKKAKKKQEVPIAAVITYNNKILSKAFNRVNKKNNIINHAEILAINKASKKLNNWRLNECTLYVTLEPCSMCKEIIKKCRISEVYYFTKQNLENTESNVNYTYIDKNSVFSQELKNFFLIKR